MKSYIDINNHELFRLKLIQLICSSYLSVVYSKQLNVYLSIATRVHVYPDYRSIVAMNIDGPQ